MPHRFPQEAVLRDGQKLLIRPFSGRDTSALHEFFLRLPADVRRFAWDRVTDRSLVESWGNNIDYSKVLPLLALDGNTIVADATLHQRRRGPLRLVGRIKWLMDPAFRGLGLGTTLVNNFIAIARDSGLHFLTCMLIAEEEADAIKTFRQLGFAEHVFPGYGVDPDGNPHDMIKLILDLTPKS